MNYDFDYDYAIVITLIDNGYEIEGSSDIYSVSKDDSSFYAKVYYEKIPWISCNNWTWHQK